jgi:hypothetical protein
MTVTQGGDYSYDRPDPACLCRSGWRFVVRYTSSTASKNMSPAEVRALVAAGLWVVTVWQEGKAAPLQGRARGVTAAQQARAQAESCGMPRGRPVYFALDVDPNPLTTTQWNSVIGFLDGAASVLGRAAVGVYGGRKAVELMCPGYAPWGWQTRSWSGGIWSPKAQLQQYVVDTASSPVRLCGGAVDYDRATAPDYGQWQPGKVPGGVVAGRKLDAADKAWLTGQFAQAVTAR